jgi:hypothetical protein
MSFHEYIDPELESLLSLLAVYSEYSTTSLIAHILRVQALYDELPFVDLRVAVDLIAARTAYQIRN